MSKARLTVLLEDGNIACDISGQSKDIITSLATLMIDNKEFDKIIKASLKLKENFIGSQKLN